MSLCTRWLGVAVTIIIQVEVVMGICYWFLPPRNLGSCKSGCCFQCRIISHATTRTRPGLNTVIDLYLSCRFVCGCSCNEVDTVTGVNLFLSKSEYQKMNYVTLQAPVRINCFLWPYWWLICWEMWLSEAS